MDFWGVIDRISRNRITFRPFRPDYALMRPISAQFNSATRQVTPDRPETYCAMRARPARGFFRRRIMSISGAGPDEGFGHCQVVNSNEKKNEAVSVGLQRPPS